MRNFACDYKPASLNSILFVFEIWKIWILFLGGENVSYWDFPGQLSQFKWSLFFCNKLAKPSVQIFLCRLFSENKKSFWVCHTGCQQSLPVKAAESVCFSPPSMVTQGQLFFFKPSSMTHFFSIGTDLAFMRHQHPADREQPVHLWWQMRKLQHLITKWGLEWMEWCRLISPRREKSTWGWNSPLFHWLTIQV